ncbi:type VI secretion system baseplate subunit TssF/IglH [Francisella adeliensis]|uniref:Uncharacterized protein n=1 Tax=Francisella adeliensis TaxID=2007306 RepID=A0A2Z4Y123_9GAMM|nr:type VI secretion system baseplate subunit TssF/IglH [Francisella adeliensis]AXA34578.1 hypothetical protein CDH04_09300 [Francisella adeliensis]MBK2086302.1 hypothetical protein [Francisella adeliensis]MBK2096518.1 hypothetical protein [Francisella adeliensis]QIW12823.1 hypothetical protein FZC43_09315 [Francisella adeliensis]QIW14700.1 hypothetical protein FZC44_09305 [Francisella adeliensis]
MKPNNNENYQQRLIDILREWKVGAEENFIAYAEEIYKSKIYDYFNGLVAPSFHGVFVKVEDIKFYKDDQHIDQFQELYFNDNSSRILYCAKEITLMPCEITEIEFQSVNLQKLNFKNIHGDFEINNGILEFWFHPKLDIKRAIYIYQNISKYAKIRAHLSDKRIVEKDVTIDFGNSYPFKKNTQIKNNMSDPKLQFKLSVNLSSFEENSFERIELLISNQLMDISVFELRQAFITNLLPMINYNFEKSLSIYIDGHQERYWFDLEKETNYTTEELRCIMIEKNVLDPTSYKTIYKGGKIGFELNSIAPYMNKSVVAHLFVNNILSLNGDIANYDAVWYEKNVSLYKMRFSSFIQVSEDTVNIKNIESLSTILKAHDIFKWTSSSWLNLLGFFDKFSCNKVKPLFRSSKVEDNLIFLEFNCMNHMDKVWINYYVSQVKEFILHNIPFFDFDLKVIF